VYSCVRFLKIDNECILIVLIDVIQFDLMYSYDEDSTVHRDRVAHCFRSIIICLKSRLYRDRLCLNSNVFASKSNHISHLFYCFLHDFQKILIYHFLQFFFFALINDNDDDITMTQRKLKNCLDARFERLSCFVFCLEEESE
jgi:hypothetical protein